ncbi:glycoside hydrolase family 3 C-terminal domain-containing protein [Streptomyces sp. NPDC000618]|uniref:glycoside hydrolase family 3 C-terminal domain-containing protein n=1 Tax=Streptomyces sp. NPDC000618 TaxID=3154265 RepID=UPI0033296DEC
MSTPPLRSSVRWGRLRPDGAPRAVPSLSSRTPTPCSRSPRAPASTSRASTSEPPPSAILRLRTPPYDERTGPLERYFHTGRLAFDADELAPVLDVCAKVPTVVDVCLERPAAIPEIADAAAALVGNYGAGDGPLLDVLFGRRAPEGRLPFQLPRSMADVERRRSDVPSDGTDPVFEYGHGLAYATPGAG